MTVSTPKDTPDAWFAGFAAGLVRGPGCLRSTRCLSGDTSSTTGTDLLSLTINRAVAAGKPPCCAPVRGAGDEIWVTGTIGDGALGLAGGVWGGWPILTATC